MSINIKLVFPLACFLAWLLFVVSCEKPADPPVTPEEPPRPDTTIVIGFGDTVTVPVDTTLASFYFTNNYCVAACSIAFTNTSYNASSFYNWDFGDGQPNAPSTSNLIHPIHYYKHSGTYQVELTAVSDQYYHNTQVVVINRPSMPYTVGSTQSEYGEGFVQTSDGGYVVAGSIEIENAGFNVYLLKTDASRNILWQKNFGGSENDNGNAVQQTPDGGFIITGSKTSMGNRDLYLIRTDADGNTIWSKTYGGFGYQGGDAVVCSDDGGFVVAGIYNSSSSSQDRNVLLLKTDGDGILVWEKHFGHPIYQSAANCLQRTSDGGYIIGGYGRLHTSDATSCLLKTDSEGNMLWENEDIPNLNSTQSIDETSDGGFILAGTNSAPTNRRIILVKITADGVVEWSKTDYNNGNFYDDVTCIRQTSDSGYILCGAADKSTGIPSDPVKKDVLVIKTDASGNTIWNKTFNNLAGIGVSNAVQETTEGEYIIVGSLLIEIFPFHHDYDIYLLKLDTNGNPE